MKASNTFFTYPSSYTISETALNKIAYIAENNDKVIFLGDMFHTCANNTLFFNTVYKFFSKPEFEGKFISILGNHDIFHNNQASINRTTIGSLELTGVLEIKRSSFEIDGWQFDVSPVVKDLSKLGRDLNKIIFVDNLKSNAKYNPKNLYLIPTWIDDIYDDIEEKRCIENIMKMLMNAVTT